MRWTGYCSFRKRQISSGLSISVKFECWRRRRFFGVFKRKQQRRARNDNIFQDFMCDHQAMSQRNTNELQSVWWNGSSWRQTKERIIECAQSVVFAPSIHLALWVVAVSLSIVGVAQGAGRFLCQRICLLFYSSSLTSRLLNGMLQQK